MVGANAMVVINNWRNDSTGIVVLICLVVIAILIFMLIGGWIYQVLNEKKKRAGSTWNRRQ